MLPAMRSFLLACCLCLFACGDKAERPVEAKDDAKDTTKPKLAESTVNPYAGVDVSPMDMSYYPAEYPKLKMARSVNGPPLAKVIYSRPRLLGRNLYPSLLKNGEPWRLGANEATELHFYKDVSIQGKKIKADRYVLYCIPEQDQWTIVFNSSVDSWGLTPDRSKDLVQFVVPLKRTNVHVEYFTMVFEKTGTGSDLIMAWDDIEARLPIDFN